LAADAGVPLREAYGLNQGIGLQCAAARSAVVRNRRTETESRDGGHPGLSSLGVSHVQGEISRAQGCSPERNCLANAGCGTSDSVTIIRVGFEPGAASPPQPDNTGRPLRSPLDAMGRSHAPGLLDRHVLHSFWDVASEHGVSPDRLSRLHLMTVSRR